MSLCNICISVSSHFVNQYGRQSNGHCRRGSIGTELVLALRWWREVLQEEFCEMRRWNEPEGSPAHLFCDARSTPPQVAAVLMRRGEQTLYCDLAPSAELMAFFRERGDGQIMSLELLSIALGTPPFAFQHGLGSSIILHRT